MISGESGARDLLCQPNQLQADNKANVITTKTLTLCAHA
jgi:hypothetical protein